MVIKPAISAGSFRTRRFRHGQAAEGQAFLDALAAEGDVMVQPYMPAIEHGGERALVWIDGEFTHAVGKSPRFSDGEERVSQATPVSDFERRFGEFVLSRVPDADGLLYARVDLIPDDDDAPRLSELELIEPSLFLLQHPPALARFTKAIRRRAAS